MDVMDIVSGAASVATGGIFGGLLRLVPEGLKLWQAKGDRDHEFRMAELAGAQARDGSAQRIREMEAASTAAIDAKGMDALVEAIRGQMQVTGNKVADALNFSVRPVTTYFFLALYGAHKATHEVLWTQDDYAILGGILSFWFLNRVLEKGRR